MSLKNGTSTVATSRTSTGPDAPVAYRRSQIQNRLADSSPTDSFPSSAAFDAINQTLQADEGERKNAVNSAKAIVAFNLKNAKGEEQSWYLDLKNKGEVGKGAAPAGGKADGDFGSPNMILYAAANISA